MNDNNIAKEQGKGMATGAERPERSFGKGKLIHKSKGFDKAEKSYASKKKELAGKGHGQWLTQQIKKDNPAYYAVERRATRARRKDK